jgi:hypothetical protein
VQTTVSLIDDLEAAIHSGAADKRAAMLRGVTDLFLGDVEQYGDEQIDLFGDVLNKLIEQVEGRVLPELSQRLAPVDRAPQSVVRKLAYNDDIAVASPVLSQSSQLTDNDLAEIAAKQGQDHLGAICERSRIAPVVTDVIVRRGDAAVVRKLSRNQGASFSQAGFGILTKRAETDGRLAESLASRPDIPAEMIAQAVSKLSEVERRRLADRLAKHGDRREVKTEARPPIDYHAAEAVVDKMQLNGELNESAIVDFATAQRSEEVIVGLARLCSAPIALIDKLIQNHRYDGILIACKACGMHWPTFKAILSVRSEVQVTPAELERARADFLKLKASTAQRMLRFWLVRGVPS